MALIHYSADPLKEVYSVPPEKQTNCTKPQGLWFSTNAKDGWRNWCNSEDFRQTCFNYKTKIKFKEGARILSLGSKTDLDNFHKKYAKSDWSVDWPTLTKQYDAIYFPKYYPEYRNKYDWYDTWDVASGCVWNAEALVPTASKPVETEMHLHEYEKVA